MKKSNIFLAIAAVALGVSSCYKDLGNYDYVELEDFEIKELEKNYSVISFRDHLKISPEIVSNSKDFEYRWFVSYMVDMETEKVDTISKEKVLDVPFEYKTGTYPLHLKVKNLETGVSKYVSTEVRCTTPFMDAFYILKQTEDGNTEMDIHYPVGEASTDMIAKSAGAPLKGAPKTLSYLPLFSYLDPELGENVVDHVLIPSSEQDRVTFRLADMQVARSNEDWFYSPYPIDKIKCALPMWAGVILVTEDGVHQNYQVPAWQMFTSGIFSDIPNRTEDLEGSFYDVSSNVCVFNEGGFTNTFFYNKRTNQFINVDFNSAARHCQLMNGELVEELEGDVLQLVGTSLDGSRLFIICQRKDGSRYYYMAEGYGSVQLPIVKKAEFKNFPEFDHAEKYAGSRRGGNILYSLYQNHVYAYNPDSESVEQLVFKSLPEGKIVYLDTEHLIMDLEEEKSFNYLMVGVENGGKYSLAMYNMVGGIPVKGEGPARVLEGEGQLHSVQYVNSFKTANSTGMGEWSIHY